MQAEADTRLSSAMNSAAVVVNGKPYAGGGPAAGGSLPRPVVVNGRTINIPPISPGRVRPCVRMSSKLERQSCPCRAGEQPRLFLPAADSISKTWCTTAQLWCAFEVTVNQLLRSREGRRLSARTVCSARDHGSSRQAPSLLCKRASLTSPILRLLCGM